MRKKVIFAVSAALALASAFAFVDNVSVVLAWRRAFAECAGDASKMPEAFSGILPAFDWAAVDFSCVSTFIPFFGFTLLAIAVMRVMRGRKADAQTFPFFAAYDRFNVALGLVGTLWGIILIGYYDMETVTMASLMSCLHTALFSTLVAVVWVYVVVHPILIPLARNALAQDDFVAEDDDRALAEMLDDLRAAANGVGSILEREEEAVRGFSATLSSSGEAIEALAASVRDTAEAVRERDERIAAMYDERAKALSAAHDAAIAKMSQTLDSLVATLRDSAKASADETASAVKAAIAAIEEERKASDAAIAAAFEKRLGEMDAADMERRRKFAEALSVRLKEVEEAQKSREAQFDEILSGRIAKLSRESHDNAARADTAESALARIKAAIG